MNIVTLQQPSRVVFGEGALGRFAEEFRQLGFRKLFLLTAPPIRPLIAATVTELENAGAEVRIYDRITAEPALDEVLEIIDEARSFGADSVAGIRRMPYTKKKVNEIIVLIDKFSVEIFADGKAMSSLTVTDADAEGVELAVKASRCSYVKYAVNSNI